MILNFPWSSSPHSVLIVDASEDSREVLRTALEHRGVRIFEAENARQGGEIARRRRPSLIVLDRETDSADVGEVRRQYLPESDARTPLVILGSIRKDEMVRPADQVLSKPYHYAPLVRKIEQLLEATDQANKKAA